MGFYGVNFMVLFLRLVVVFIFHIAPFLLQPVTLICSQAHILTSWEFQWYPVTENSSILGVHQVTCVCT